MKDSDLAIVAIFGLVGIAAYMGYVTYLSHLHSTRPAGSETWEVRSDSQGIPERITIRR